MKTLLFLVSLMIIPLPALAGMTEIKDQLYETTGLDLNGFIESRYGLRCQNDPHQKDESLAEIRLQIDLARDFDWGVLKIKGDLLHDQVIYNTTGEFRELNLLFSPLDNMDIKIGQQVLTWGTGDMLFINDLFPKDWQSFFIGRDDEYLKAPGNGIKTSLFYDIVNIDFVYTPTFEPSEYISGERLSYWNPMTGSLAGNTQQFGLEKRNSTGRDSEYAVRLFKNKNSMELALYGYYGFWKTPEGMTPGGKLRYPRLSVYGGSIRTPLWGGIGSLETGYYHSSQANSGHDPLTRNDEIRFLTGFEKEIGHELTASSQYYLEWMQDYTRYTDSLPPGSVQRDEYRSVFTLRITKLLMNQNLVLSFFGYYSPTDNDCYLRPKVQYKITDNWRIETGGNVFIGKNQQTFFGQFEKNTNIYMGLRFNY
jgi:hypothetical protein